QRPLLFLDVDGVISLFGFAAGDPPPGTFHWVDGVMHCIDETAGERIRTLSEHYEIVWATGWEEKANEYLPHLLNLHVTELPVLTFDGRARSGSSHRKIDAIDEYARGRAAAWRSASEAIALRANTSIRGIARRLSLTTAFTQSLRQASVTVSAMRSIRAELPSKSSATARPPSSNGTPRRTSPRTTTCRGET